MKTKITKREAVSNIKKSASMLAKFINPNLLKKNDLIDPFQILEQIVWCLEQPLNSEYKKECLDALNQIIDKKFTGAKRNLVR